MAWQAIVYSYGLAGKAWGLAKYVVWLMIHELAWCIEWPGRSQMLYSIAWRASHGIME